MGTYTYHATKKHQVASTSNGWSFAYDANGNMHTGRGSTIDWTSFNYPASIANGANTSTFSYTPSRQYWKQVSNYASGGAATTIYVGGLLEKVTTAAGTDYRHMIRAGSSTIVVSRQSSGTNSNTYVMSDHLGSSSAVTNGSGGVLVSSSFDAFGKRRGSNWSGSPSAADWTAIAATTRRGYTEHTMLDNVGLIHMNGRVQDPVLGRFVSADPFITEPGNTQNFNRYSYVYNNPLAFTDPSGFDACGSNGGADGSACAEEEKKKAEEQALRERIKNFLLNSVTRQIVRTCNDACRDLARSALQNGVSAVDWAQEYLANPWGLQGAEISYWNGMQEITICASCAPHRYLGHGQSYGTYRCVGDNGCSFNGTNYVVNDAGLQDVAKEAFYSYAGGRALAGLASELGAARGVGQVGRAWCFPAGTLVHTPQGTTEIQNIKPGDIVLALDETSGELVSRSVVEIARSWSNTLVELTVGETQIISTASHSYWVASAKKWIAARDLKTGMHVRLLDGGTREIDAVQILDQLNLVEVFNFTVGEHHNYFVGAGGVLVHNGGPELFDDYNQARNAALGWLESRGFRAESQVMGKFGPNAGAPIGMSTADGRVGFRVEFDGRSGAHINVFAGKEKGPHIQFKGTQDTVNNIIRQFLCK